MSMHSRSEAADLLGISVSKLRRLQADGDIESEVDDSGRHHFDLDDLRELADERGFDFAEPDEEDDDDEPEVLSPPSPTLEPQPAPVAGDLAARAFRLFQDGAPPVEVVIALEITPETAEALQDAWVRMTARELPVLGAEVRLAEVEDDVAGQAAQLRALASAVADVRRDLEAVRAAASTRRAGSHPLGPCQCGRGLVVPAKVAVCSGCHGSYLMPGS
ncbi:MAG: hypothetical protein P1V51_02780 [Deltaproteobacteria bacterium]|nr:hypothetical protein [Deltaproteobacteria bacterium]